MSSILGNWSYYGLHLSLIKDIKGIIHIIHKFVAFFWSTHWTIVLEMDKNSSSFIDFSCVGLGLYVLTPKMGKY